MGADALPAPLVPPPMPVDHLRVSCTTFSYCASLHVTRSTSSDVIYGHAQFLPQQEFEDLQRLNFQGCFLQNYSTNIFLKIMVRLDT